MDVLNMNPHPVSVKLKTDTGMTDYATAAPGRRITLPAHCVVDRNWLAESKRIAAYENSTTEEPIVLGPAPIVAPAAQTGKVVASVPASTQAPTQADVTVNENKA